MNTINEFIQSLEMGTPQTFHNLSIQFIHGKKSRLNILNYDEALDRKILEITEVSDIGDVPHLRFQNKGDLPVFLQEGAVIEGLKQSRTIRTSFVVNQHQEVVASVHCVEQSRWQVKSRVGIISPAHVYLRLKALNAKRILQSLKKEGAEDSQLDTWRSIKKKLAMMAALSETDNINDIYLHAKKDVEEYLKAFTCPDSARGLLAMIDEHAVSLDVYVTQDLFRKNYEGLLSGVVMEAIDTDFCKELAALKKLSANQFIQRLLKTNKESFPSVGIGEDIRFGAEGQEISGGALAANDTVYHLEAFAV